MALEGYGDNDAKTYKGSDIDSDGDGTVDESDSALTYKGNDIDTDGDGQVDSADDSDALGGTPAADYTTDTELTNHTNDSDAHHAKYTDAEAVTAIENDGNLNIDITGDADTVDGKHAADIPGLPAPIYGDGSDGTITRSSNGNENGLIYATTYELQSGVTRDVTSGVLVVCATEKIVIDGHLTGTGHGGAGGSGGAGSPGVDGSSSNGNPGDPGTAADVVGGNGAGGNGGSGVSGETNGNSGGNGGTAAGGGGGSGRSVSGVSSGNGGDGGDGTDSSYSTSQVDTLRNILAQSNPWSDVWSLAIMGGGGGGGGGGGSGGAYTNGPGTDGGDGRSGGDGGGVVILCAPEISGSGTVSAAGQDGTNGQNGGGGFASGGGGGAGGGGDGGLVVTVTSDMLASLTYDVTGGTGGSGGSGADNGGNGGDGGNGASGELIHVGSQP